MEDKKISTTEFNSAFKNADVNIQFSHGYDVTEELIDLITLREINARTNTEVENEHANIDRTNSDLSVEVPSTPSLNKSHLISI